jgi:hypothetical protein
MTNASWMRVHLRLALADLLQSSVDALHDASPKPRRRVPPTPCV